MISNHIIQHIFKSWGIPTTSGTFTLLSNEFKLKKEISIELDNSEIIRRPIWGAQGQIGTSQIKLILSDLGVDSQEYVLICQLDNLSVYAFKLYADNDGNLAFVAHENDAWIELSNLLLARLLVGIEQINEIFVQYIPLGNYQDLYKYLISFVNYAETKIS